MDVAIINIIVIKMSYEVLLNESTSASVLVMMPVESLQEEESKRTSYTSKQSPSELLGNFRLWM